MTKANHNSRQQAINKARGYVPLWRDFWSLPIAKHPTASRLYPYMLCRAAHEAFVYHSNCGLDIPLQIGEFTDSLKSIAEDLRIHRTNCHKVVKMLVKAGLLTYRRVSYKLSVFTLTAYQEWKDIRSVTQESHTSTISSIPASTICAESNTNVRPNSHISAPTVTQLPQVPDSPPQDPLLYPLPHPDKEYLPDHLIKALWDMGKIELGMGGAWVTKEFKEKLERRYTKQEIHAAAENMWKWANNTKTARDGTPYYLMYRRAWQNHEKLIEKELLKITKKELQHEC